MHPGKKNPRHQYKLQSTLLGKNLGLLVDTKLNASQQCAPAEKKANGILGCIRQSIASSLKEEILALSTGEAAPEVLYPDLDSSAQERHGATG